MTDVHVRFRRRTRARGRELAAHVASAAVLEKVVDVNMRRYLRRFLDRYPSLKRLVIRVLDAGAANEQWVRVVMNKATTEMISTLGPGMLNVLEISGEQWRTRLPFKSYKAVFYPDFDICSAPLEQSFDLIIAEQVFEHLLWPYRAGKNVYRMLAPGGRFLVTTPFLLRYHPAPEDCTRWTEVGIRHFLAECGFGMDLIQTGSWGNRACLRANLSRWRRYRPWFHSLRNEQEVPLVVWALAQKR